VEIEIYGKNPCPFCDRAKQLLDKEGHEYTYKLLGKDFNREQMMEKFPTARTFPQIVIDNENIGGYDNLCEYLDLRTYN
jgi:glutaredoxin|tara:strand:+ start:61 stop:297 length:237 start_codon:yes stop_codon:yes gene_type:complete